MLTLLAQGNSLYHYYGSYTLQVGAIAAAIEHSPEKMFVSPDGNRVYFLSNRPGEILIRVDTMGETDYKTMDPEQIREHVRSRLHEGGIDDIDV